MIKHESGITTITCDKCQKQQDAPSESYNDSFYADGWALNKGRKYMHLCYNCLSARSRRAMNAVKERFGLPPTKKSN